MRHARLRLILFAAVAVIAADRLPARYPTPDDRLRFARGFGDNKATRLFYGEPHDLLTVGGYMAWRVGGVLVIFAAVWGAARGHPRAARRGGRGAAGARARGRRDRARGVPRRRSPRSPRARRRSGWRRSPGSWRAACPRADRPTSRWRSSSVVPVFAGVGALASQLAPTRRVAIALATARARRGAAAAGGRRHLGALDWLRWAHAARVGGGAAPVHRRASARAAAARWPRPLALLVGAGAIAVRRDVGTRPARARATARRPAPAPARLAPRRRRSASERGSLVAWARGIGVFAFLFGRRSRTASPRGSPTSLREQLEQARRAPRSPRPSGYLGFTFLFFVLARQPLRLRADRGRPPRGGAISGSRRCSRCRSRRRRWLAGRLLLAAGGAAALALLAGVLAWAGAASQGATSSLADMLAAGANCLPAGAPLPGLAALGFAVAPRASAGSPTAWSTSPSSGSSFGPLLGAPGLDPRPLAVPPRRPRAGAGVRAGAAAAMLAAGAAAALGRLGLRPPRPGRRLAMSRPAMAGVRPRTWLARTRPAAGSRIAGGIAMP